MLPVTPKNEPSNFDAKVRKPGTRFLATKAGTKATQKEWKSHNYWVRSLRDLYTLYGGLCSYTCQWIPLITGSNSVEHFIPKEITPGLAYEWSNYRLVCGTMNGRKQENSDVLDPFSVVQGMFTMEFPSLLIKPGLNLSQGQRDLVESTIARLKLNGEDTIESRKQWLSPYVEGTVTFDYLESKAPFLSHELSRQNLTTAIKTMMTL